MSEPEIHARSDVFEVLVPLTRAAVGITLRLHAGGRWLNRLDRTILDLLRAGF